MKTAVVGALLVLAITVTAAAPVHRVKLGKQSQRASSRVLGSLSGYISVDRLTWGGLHVRITPCVEGGLQPRHACRLLRPAPGRGCSWHALVFAGAYSQVPLRAYHTPLHSHLRTAHRAACFRWTTRPLPRL